MIYSLENSSIRIKTSTHGGEIQSITSKEDKTEYLWDGNPEYWKYHAPILFPIIGKVVDSKYRVNGKTYKLPQHGLARTSEFSLVENNNDEITFELRYSEDTLKVYPYKFSLKSNYKLEGSTVIVTYTVENVDEMPIHFSIGSHPAFLCPIDKDDTLNDCYIEFNEVESSKRITLTKEGYLSKDKEACLENTEILKLNKELFKDDALVFEDLKSNKMTIKSNNSNKTLEVDFTGFPYMGIWAPKDGAPFVCIEPWYGHADYYDFEGEFIEKEGVIKLEVNKKFSCMFKVTVK
ncbi:aldose 1-epimerase [Clostridium puniceum]|uniref:Aldose 1-epimerase n=1 Tax=Clostridium puniceum TaxID=29367 RepID=A0A1S8TWI1_9CLOT|nr:aldose 1-epimerase family protein [Clostridium puniceum]OOM82096.1 aldose 1-epimerase [Clostridium puniceum]